MVIIEITYIKPLSEVDRLIQKHIQFLESHYDQGVFIASGKKIPRDGGIILALTDKATAAEIIKQDPFYQENVAEYRLIEFEPSKYDTRLNDMFFT